MKQTNYKTLLALTIFLSILVWSSGRAQHRDGIDTVATLNTFAPVGEFYKMDYTGDYNELLDILDEIYTGGRSGYEDFKCSLFSAKGDPSNLIFGRNFDNPENDVMLVRYHPPDGYTSMAFTRMSDMGYAVGTNYPNLTFQQKLHLLKCAYFVPDGINEHGLAAGLAWHEGIAYTIDPSKDTIFITRLIRELLDHASNIQEALDIANSYNVCDAAVNVISHHVLVGTAAGESVTLEYSGGEFRAVTSDSAWQVLTNIPVYNIPHSQLMAN
ncbi:MAG: linear amide C-N hydrolase, partial [Bacteroidetes bacterium]|nr:linear amide C-N hydrolase [Bacteroidota bacterium]